MTFWARYFFGANSIPNCKPFIATVTFNLFFVHSILSLNVRGQGTRHLVEGTLDPLVGSLIYI